MRHLALALLLVLAAALPAQEVLSATLPDMDPIELAASATFQLEDINESSAIVHSRQYDTVFWTLNDSGDSARIFPFALDGSVYAPEWMEDYTGIAIPDAVNIDWEDMAVDAEGNLIIGACGNNDNIRRDLALYIVREPHPLGTVQTRYLQRICFHYPEQTAFPPEMVNFDCEAVFCAGGHVYLLTKHRSDTNTVLYRLDTMDPNEDNPATKLATFAIQGMVTAADCTPDGTKLAVLTYDNIWVFTSDTPGEWFTGRKQWMPISAKQCEGICWNGDQLIITNEQMEIIEVPMDKFLDVK